MDVTPTTASSSSIGTLNHFQFLSEQLQTIEKQLVDRFNSNNNTQEHNIDPVAILTRLRKLQDNLKELENGITEIFQAKKEAIDITKNVLLLFNRRILHDISHGSVDETLRPQHMNPQDSERQFHDWSQRFLDQYITWQQQTTTSISVEDDILL
jgi:hypothetical protein